MNLLRSPFLAKRSMVWIVAVGKTMLMRLLMELRLMLICARYTTSVYRQRSVRSNGLGISRGAFCAPVAARPCHTVLRPLRFRCC